MILADAFYNWIQVGIQGGEVVLGLGLIAGMTSAVFLTASGRRTGVIAVALPPAWLVLFSGWADFPIPTWQVIFGLLAGVTMWHAVHANSIRGLD